MEGRKLHTHLLEVVAPSIALHQVDGNKRNRKASHIGDGAERVTAVKTSRNVTSVLLRQVCKRSRNEISQLRWRFQQRSIILNSFTDAPIQTLILIIKDTISWDLNLRF